MALSDSELADGLENMTPTASEAVAVDALAAAFENYFYDATVMSILVQPGTLSAAKAAMAAALSGMSSTGAGATKIQDGVAAFWVAVSAASSSIWAVPGFVVAPAIPPVAILGLADALTAVLAASTAANLSLSDAATAAATVLHASGGLGGTVLLTPTGPGSPVVTPIL